MAQYCKLFTAVVPEIKKMKAYICLFLTLCLLLLTSACSDDVEGSGDNVRESTNQGPDNWPDSGQPGADINVDDCTPGEELGCAGAETVWVCDDDGEDAVIQDCPSDTPYCHQGSCSDQVCNPGEWECVDSDSRHRCNEDGTGWEEAIDCPGEDLCSGGTCGASCELGSKMTSSYFGCEYWAVYLDQYDDPFTGIGGSDVSYALVISNPNEEPATIQFQSFDAETAVNIADPVVPAGQSRAFDLPRAELDGTGITRKAIFVRSSLPVTAHQFNPANNENVYSNDASLLLPVSVLGSQYYVMNWPSGASVDLFDFEPQQSYVTIIATSQGTTNLVFNSKAEIVGGGDISGFPAGVSRNFELQYGDVLNLHAGSDDLMGGQRDLTGSLIQADQPVAVFAGHEQAVVAYDNDRDSCCADHIEQQLWPVQTLGHRYIAAFSPGRTNTKDNWRILAAEEGVTVHTDPPQPEANGVTLNAGEFVEFFSADDFEVNATGKVMVGQFLASQQQTNEYIGDPAFVLAVPVERFRDEYLVLVPEDYSKDYITITRPAGAEITLADEVVDDSEFSAVGPGEFETASIEVQAGAYHLESAETFGVVVHGLDNAVSYGYPGGLDIVGDEQ